MGRIIAIANQKGGVGKTTTSINLSACLAEAGKKVLVVDLDPQGNTTSGLGVDKNRIDRTVYEMMLGEFELGECIIPDLFDHLDLVPSNVNLSGAEIELIGIDKKEYILKSALAEIRDKYEFIIIDCPPLGSVSDALITGRLSDGVALVVASEVISYKFAQKIKKQLENADCKILGVVLNKVDLKGRGYYGKYYGRYYGKYYGKYYGEEYVKED